MHLTESGVCTSVDGPAVDVVAEQVRLKDEDADVGDGTEVNKLTDLMLEETFVDERHEQTLYTSCQHHNQSASAACVAGQGGPGVQTPLRAAQWGPCET